MKYLLTKRVQNYQVFSRPETMKFFHGPKLVANRRLTTSRDSARIGYIAISRRLNNLNSRLVYIMSVIIAIGIEIKVTEAVDYS